MTQVNINYNCDTQGTALSTAAKLGQNYSSELHISSTPNNISILELEKIYEKYLKYVIFLLALLGCTIIIKYLLYRDDTCPNTVKSHSTKLSYMNY